MPRNVVKRVSLNPALFWSLVISDIFVLFRSFKVKLPIISCLENDNILVMLFIDVVDVFARFSIILRENENEE